MQAKQSAPRVSSQDFSGAGAGSGFAQRARLLDWL
jgi:hypothetical protein